MARRPLEDLRVIDVSGFTALLASRLLADLGADVIRLEDAATAVTADADEWLSLASAVRNASKRVARVTSSTEDLHACMDLIETADVIITNGCSEIVPAPLEELSERCPGLVIVSVSDFGRSGPYAGYQATGTVMATTGWMLYKSGTPDLPPVLPPGWIPHDIASIVGAFAPLTGVHHRRKTGVGQLFEVSVQEAALQTTDWSIPNTSYYSSIGIELDEVRSGGGEAQPILPCRDGWVRAAILSASEWRRMRAWLGDPEDLADPELETLRARVAAYPSLIRPHLVRLFAGLTMVEASGEGLLRRIPITPVLRPSDILQADQYRALGTFVTGHIAPRAERHRAERLLGDRRSTAPGSSVLLSSAFSPPATG